MSLHPIRSGFRSAVGAVAAIALVGGGSAVDGALSAAQAQGAAQAATIPVSTAPIFSPDQCRAIASTTTDIFKHFGAERFSEVFRQSMIDFIMASGKMTCTGPLEIAWTTKEDAAGFNTIASELLVSKLQLSLEKVGVKLAANPTVANSRPTLQRRSEAASEEVRVK